MIPKDTLLFASFHSNDRVSVLPMLDQIRAAGWNNIKIPDEQTDIPDTIRECGMAIIFVSKSYAVDDRMMLEQFAYAATVIRRLFIPIWLDDIDVIRESFQDAEYDSQLLSALEMLTAKHNDIGNPGTHSDSSRFIMSLLPRLKVYRI